MSAPKPTSGQGRFGTRYKRALARNRHAANRAWEERFGERWIEHGGKLYPRDSVVPPREEWLR